MFVSNLPSEVRNSLIALQEHYDSFEEVSRGASGYLYFARNRISNATVAIKFYSGLPGDERHDEPRRLQSISSPNVLQILDARNVSDEWAYFVTPRCTGGDIDDLIHKRPSVYEAIDVTLGVCAGVSAIHAQGMIHRDLKPANIVIEGLTPKIADFGSVKLIVAGDTVFSATQHTVLYRPPESFATRIYTVKGDVYQIGLLLYQLLGGYLPYDGTAYLTVQERKIYDALPDDIERSIYVDEAIRERAQSGSLIDFGTLPPWISEAGRRAIRQMTSPDPSVRSTNAADIAAQLTHLRSVLSDWRWDGFSGKLKKSDRTIELRPASKQGLYEAFQYKASGLRRVPGIQISTLAMLVRQFSGD